MGVQVNDPLILECARAIRLYLPDLLLGAEDQVSRMDRALSELLAEADRGHQVEERILDVLREPSAVQDWAAAFIQHGAPPDVVEYADRAYQPAPGDGNPVGARKYACPVAGDTLWWRRAVGQEIPRCVTHGDALEPVAEV
jgi:hypothetical protein